MGKPSHLKKNLPKVSCLTVTANRRNLIRRAVRCFQNQSYPNKELVVIDDGEEDLEEVLQILPSGDLNYIKLTSQPGNTLGKLRNRSLEERSEERRVEKER